MKLTRDVLTVNEMKGILNMVKNIKDVYKVIIETHLSDNDIDDIVEEVFINFINLQSNGFIDGNFLIYHDEIKKFVIDNKDLLLQHLEHFKVNGVYDNEEVTIEINHILNDIESNDYNKDLIFDFVKGLYDEVREYLQKVHHYYLKLLSESGVLL